MEKRCRVCKEEAVIEIPYEGKAYCKKHFINRFKRRVMRTITKMKWLNPEDRIGFFLDGRESFVSLYILMPLMKRWKSDVLAFCIGDTNDKDKAIISYARDVCKELDIPLHVINAKRNAKSTGQAGYRMEIIPILETEAKRLGLTRIITGYDLNEFVSDSFINFVDGNFGDTWNERFVHPLVGIPSEEVGAFADMHGIMKLPSPRRERFKEAVFNEINTMERKFPGLLYSARTSIERIWELMKLGD